MVEFVKFKKNSDDPNDGSDSNPDSLKKSWFSFKRLIGITILAIVSLMLISSCTLAIAPKIAVVPIEGAITTVDSQSLFNPSISSRTIANQIYTLADDSSVQAIVLDINSGGGSPVASDEISQAVEYATKKKQVVAVVSDIGASGAYWVSASTDKIYAAPLSIVGSIGVTSATLSFENLIKEYNITYRRQIAGEYKDMGSPFREQSEDEKIKMQMLLDSVHEEFILHISEHRNLSYNKTKQLSTGEIFLGKDAINLGLVDEIGYMEDAINDLLNEYGNSTMVLEYDPGFGSTSLFSMSTGDLFQNSNSLPIELR